MCAAQIRGEVRERDVFKGLNLRGEEGENREAEPRLKNSLLLFHVNMDPASWPVPLSPAVRSYVSI